MMSDGMINAGNICQTLHVHVTNNTESFSFLIGINEVVCNDVM